MKAFIVNSLVGALGETFDGLDTCYYTLNNSAISQCLVILYMRINDKASNDY